MRLRLKAIAACAIGAVLILPLVSPSITTNIERFATEFVPSFVQQAGATGPLAIILLMTLAIVASPIPSAPIAIAAGAAYGHYAGTLYVAIGSELGALTAFLIARFLGRDVVLRVLGAKIDKGLAGSQTTLTLVVFVSRLLPFISFDAMSYAAGLSQLHLWRFLVATIAGILPASFLLAHFGVAAASGEFGSAEWLIVGLGLATAVPLLWFALGGGKQEHK